MKKIPAISLVDFSEQLGQRIQHVRGGIRALSRKSGVSRPTIYRVLRATDASRIQPATVERLRRALRLQFSKRARHSNLYVRLEHLARRAKNYEGEALVLYANEGAMVCLDILRSHKLKCEMVIGFDGFDAHRRITINAHPGIPGVEISILAAPGRLMYEVHMIFGVHRSHEFGGDFGASFMRDVVRIIASLVWKARHGKPIPSREEFIRKEMAAK